MKRAHTTILKVMIMLIGLAVLALCIFKLPLAIMTDRIGAYRPIVLGLYVTAIPFFVALYQGLKLLSYVDKNKIFSSRAIRFLKIIKYCAFVISAMYAAGMPYIYYVADMDDAPGVAAIGFIIVGASFTIAAATGLFQSLLQNAIDIKSENDLTV